MKRKNQPTFNSQLSITIFSVLGILLAFASVGFEIAFVSDHLDELMQQVKILTTPVIHS